MKSHDGVVASCKIEALILSVRARRVVLDSDLARLYGVPRPDSMSRSHGTRTDSLTPSCFPWHDRSLPV
jgi:hypothetical protein